MRQVYRFEEALVPGAVTQPWLLSKPLTVRKAGDGLVPMCWPVITDPAHIDE
jgi:hypothetical protein